MISILEGYNHQPWCELPAVEECSTLGRVDLLVRYCHDDLPVREVLPHGEMPTHIIIHGASMSASGVWEYPGCNDEITQVPSCVAILGWRFAQTREDVQHRYKEIWAMLDFLHCAGVMNDHRYHMAVDYCKQLEKSQLTAVTPMIYIRNKESQLISDVFACEPNVIAITAYSKRQQAYITR